MRVGLIAPPWIPVPPPAYGGTEVVVDTLARGLVVAGHEVLLVTTGDSTCPVPRTWVYDQARTEELGSVVVELRHVLHAYEAVDGVDIVHDHTVAGPVYAALRWHGPVVTTNHGPFTDDAKAVYRSIAGRVPIVAISHHQASTAGDVPIARVIHHGIDTTGFPVGDGQGGYLLFLGRLSPTKGVREAIDIARAAGAPLIIAAKMREVAEREYFEANVAPLLGGDIEYVGEAGRADKLRLLGAARALINPIRWDEPFGLCMIEAMACGTPVITSHRGATPEIVDDGVTGFLCRGTAEMVAAVLRVGSLDRRSCRAWVEARFSAQRMVEHHVAFYADVVAGRVDPPLDVGRSDRGVASGRRRTTHAVAGGDCERRAESPWLGTVARRRLGGVAKPRRTLMKPGLRTWGIEVVFTEEGDVTRGDALLEVAGHHYHGWGRARRNPADPDRPSIGEEVAAARALSDLSQQLLRLASEDIGGFEGHLVAVHP